MDPLNIFYHSPKELTTDAFWVWLLFFLDSSEKYEEAKQFLFDSLILREEDKGRRVGHISARAQEKCSHGRVDFYFTFTFLDDGSEHLVLFEDKTWSSTSKSQLNGYKKAFPAAYRFFYYKLAYIGIHERELVKECGYDIITARMMETGLSRFCGEHLLIRDYRNYIKDTFADYIDSFPTRLFDEKEYDLLEDAQVQLFLADCLLDAIPNLYCVGRNGQHRYNNMDHSMLTAFEAASNIKNNIKDKSNIWNVNAEAEYHEENKNE